MKFKTKLKKAFNILINKSNSDNSSMNAFFDFLGVRDVPEDSLSEATYFACLKVLSESIGKLPLKLLQHNTKNGVTTAREHPLYKILHK